MGSADLVFDEYVCRWIYPIVASFFYLEKLTLDCKSLRSAMNCKAEIPAGQRWPAESESSHENLH